MLYATPDKDILNEESKAYGITEIFLKKTLSIVVRKDDLQSSAQPKPDTFEQSLEGSNRAIEMAVGQGHQLWEVMTHFEGLCGKKIFSLEFPLSEKQHCVG